MVGMHYRQAAQFVESLPKGEELMLKRDRNNAHDPWAVQVWARGRHVAFVKATEVRSLAQRMDLAKQDLRPGRLAFDCGWPVVETNE